MLWEQLLNQNNIFIPRTPLRKWMFEKEWAEAKALYEEKSRHRYYAQAGINQKSWEECRKQIKKDWDIEVEYPTFDLPRFTTPQEAVNEISKIPAPTTEELFYTVVENERCKWVQQLIAEAPADSSLIYVRSTGYYTSTADSYIKRRMKDKLEALTVMSGVCIVYIGFLKSRPLEELNLKHWTIVKTRATVEYV